MRAVKPRNNACIALFAMVVTPNRRYAKGFWHSLAKIVVGI
jgi:hypothetical protein